MNLRQLLLIGTLALASQPYAAELPPAFHAHYTIKKGFLTLGEATREFKIQPDGSLEYISRSWATGMASVFIKENVTQETYFKIQNNTIKPMAYYSESNKGTTVWQMYDWSAQKTYSRRNDDSYIYEIPEVTYDQNVYQLALMLDLADGKRNMTYYLGENKRLESYPIKYLGNKTVNTEFGELETIVIRRDQKNATTTLWCAIKLNYLPVQIDHKESGIRFSAYLDQLSGIRPTK